MKNPLPQDYLTEEEIIDLRQAVKYNLDLLYGGQAIIDSESPLPSEWSMLVPVFPVDMSNCDKSVH